MEQSEHTASGPEKQNGDRVSEIAAKAEEKVRELREQARSRAEQRVHELSEKAQHRIEDQRDRVASRIEDAATRLRQRADTAGPLGHTAGDKVAVSMESAAVYLHQHETHEMADDLSTQVRKHPLRAVFIAAVIGYLFGKVTG